MLKNKKYFLFHIKKKDFMQTNNKDSKYIRLFFFFFFFIFFIENIDQSIPNQVRN